MIISVLFRNEMLKMVHRLAFWVAYVFLTFIMVLQYGERFVRAGDDPNVTFALPEAWQGIVSDDPEGVMFFGSIVILLLVANEFSWRTARQNVIDGLSKEQWFVGKLMVVPIIGLLFLGMQLTLGGALAFFGREAGAVAPLVRDVDWSAIVGFFVAFIGTGTLALLIAMSVRSTGPAIGVFFLYLLLVERFVAFIMLKINEGWEAAVRYLPMNSFNQLTDYRLHDPQVLQAAIDRAVEGGRTPPVPGDLRLAFTMSLVWIIVFVGTAFVQFRQRDL